MALVSSFGGFALSCIEADFGHRRRTRLLRRRARLLRQLRSQRPHPLAALGAATLAPRAGIVFYMLLHVLRIRFGKIYPQGRES